MYSSDKSTKIQQVCIEWAEGYIETHKKVTGQDLNDLSHLGITSWSDSFIWLSTHCHVNLVIPAGDWHTFEQAKYSKLLSIYTMLLQHTFQIREYYGIRAAEASLHIPNFLNRHFDYISWFVAAQSNWPETAKDNHLES